MRMIEHSMCERKKLGLKFLCSRWVVDMYGLDAQEFITSWLSFVMALSMPTFCYTVWRTACISSRWELRSTTAQCQSGCDAALMIMNLETSLGLRLQL
eukprot:3745696-Amphidinium_carterae.1